MAQLLVRAAAMRMPSSCAYTTLVLINRAAYVTDRQAYDEHV